MVESGGSGVIYTNGLFMWPGVRIGYTQTTKDGYVLSTLSLRPLIFNVEGFLTPDECDYIKTVSEAYMAPRFVY